jgi:hypothetical protein
MILNKNIHVIPTDKPSRFYKINVTEHFNWSNDFLPQIVGSTNQNIYITNYEEIKDSWSYDRMMKSVNKIDNAYSEKIILTTDKDLIADGIQEIPTDFLEWFVKNQGCESVEVVTHYPTIDDEGDGSLSKKILYSHYSQRRT